MDKDPYIQENGILKNKLGIANYDELNSAEKDITFSKLINSSTLLHRNFDISFIKSIHKHIFEDIFDWAGTFREVPIIKEEIVIPGLSLDYTKHEKIEKELSECLEKLNNTDWNSLSLDEKTVTFTKYITQFWKIHPFRDGNTRTTLTFANQFSKEHGFSMDLGFLLDQLSRKTEIVNGREKITQFSIRDKFVLAALPNEFSPEPIHLEKLIKQSIVSGINKNIETLQNSISNTKEEREL
ncbi:MAG: hypothetical protein GX682_02290 [Clostridiaceae bacterium]|nr:hypothetical protein [Clostridiaceae bacterium]